MTNEITVEEAKAALRKHGYDTTLEELWAAYRTAVSEVLQGKGRMQQYGSAPYLEQALFRADELLKHITDEGYVKVRSVNNET